MERQLRDYQRNQYATSQPVDNSSFWEFVTAAVNNGGMLIARGIDFYERRNLYNQNSSAIREGLSFTSDNQNRTPTPTITYPPEQTVLPISYSTESNDRTLSTENDESNDSLSNNQA